MLKCTKSFWKLDHTICMNNNEGNIKWNIDDDPIDIDDTDCKSIEEAIDCLDDIGYATWALTFIKDKEVDIRALLDSDTVDMYNDISLRPKIEEIDFNILKEVFKE